MLTSSEYLEAQYLEAEYNNRRKVPDFSGIIQAWANDAAVFRDSHDNAEFDVAYGPTERQKLDLFWPGAARDAPIAMFIHGGYWQALDRSFASHLAHGLTAHGVAVAVPSYDLCPAVTLAELTEQLRACAGFLAHRHKRGVLAIGHSAGGHLAAMLMATDWVARGLAHDTVIAGLPISGLFDLVPLLRTTVMPDGLDEAEARRLSPMFLPSPGVPFHAIVGGDEGEEYARQSRDFAEAWGGTWESVPGANHLTVIAPLADPDSTLVRRALALLGL